MMDTVAIIPARGGSKAVPDKNVRSLSGFPLIAYSIIAAQESETIDRVIVSTDSEMIAQIARDFGAEVPFLRPAEFAGDTSVDREFLVHAMEWLLEHEGKAPEYFVHLRPTTPLRDPAVINEAVYTIKHSNGASSLRSAHAAPKTPYKWFELDRSGYFKGIRPSDTRPEYYNLPRQAFDVVYDPNGYVDIVRTSQVLGNKSVHGDKMLGFITDHTYEIDSMEDLECIEYLAQKSESPLLRFLRKRNNKE